MCDAIHLPAFRKSCGSTDNAAEYESGDCTFEPRQAQRASFYSHVFGVW